MHPQLYRVALLGFIVDVKKEKLIAKQLTFHNTISNKAIVAEAPIPQDFVEVMGLLRG